MLLLVTFDIEKERWAYGMLQWVPYSMPPAPFDIALAKKNFYSKMQKERSDAALDQFEKDHPYQSSEELIAFRKLEKLGIYTQSDYFSPCKAANGHYTRRLREFESNLRGRSTTSSKPKKSRRKSRWLYF